MQHCIIFANHCCKLHDIVSIKLNNKIESNNRLDKKKKKMDDNNNNIQSIEGIIQYYINHAFAKSEDNIRTLTSKVDGLTTKFSDLINEEDNRDDTDYFYDESLTAERHAVKRSSWGKSEGERKCRFQNNGDLHRSNGEAPLDTYSDKEGNVLRDAVACTSEGKSEGERK
jgi:hypothetical protein